MLLRSSSTPPPWGTKDTDFPNKDNRVSKGTSRGGEQCTYLGSKGSFGEEKGVHWPPLVFRLVPASSMIDRAKNDERLSWNHRRVLCFGLLGNTLIIPQVRLGNGLV